MREGVVFVSDTHTNCLAGIRTNGVTRDDGTPIELSKAGRWLLKTWETNWDAVLPWMDRVDRRTLVFVGDMAEIDAKGRTDRIISRNTAHIKTMCVNLLEPVVREFDDCYMLRGTEAHVGGSGYIEEMIAEDLGCIQDPDTDNYSWWHLRKRFAGVRFDIGHHMSMGSLPWTYSTSAARYAVETEFNYVVEWKETPPDVVIRGHNHRYTDSGTNRDVRVFGLPCWQFPPPYLLRKGKYNERPHFGSLAFICEDGENTPSERKFLYRPKRRKVW